MATNSKPTDVRNDMLQHVQYEAASALNFCRIGNTWCLGLPADLVQFTYQSILEAGLVHFRCLIEFLGAKQEGDKVMARDYVPDWSWTIGGSLVKVGQLHGRLAHLGTIRATGGAFNWAPWLDEHAPVVLGAFRDFGRQLLTVSEPRFELLDRDGLFAALDMVLDP